MLIEHTNRSTEDKPKIHLTWSAKYMCCGALRWSTRWFNQQSLYTVSEPINQVKKSQRCINQWSTQNNSSKKSTQPSQSQCPASIFVPENADCKNRNLWRVWGQVDHALTKVNASQICIETLGQNRNFLPWNFPRVREEEHPRWSNQSDDERECVMSDGENDLQNWPIYIHHWGCVTHMLRV